MKRKGLWFHPRMGYGDHWQFSQARGAIQVFMAVKATSVLKKLAGDPMRANLNEIKRQIDPQSRKWAADWVHDNRDMFDAIVRTGLIEEIQINVGSYGYGDDRGYRLTEAGLAFVQELRDDHTIACHLEEKLMGPYSRWQSYED